MSLNNYKRYVIGVSLAVGIGELLYLGWEIPVYLLIQSATLFDIFWTYRRISSSRKRIILVLGGLLTWMNWMLLRFYWNHPRRLIEIITVAQLSDTIQYIGGTHLGRWKIGFISPNKTLEGYGVSLLLISPSGLFIPLKMVILYWALGILGGLVSSGVKRYLGIKDFSNLLGPHGGWIDRADSVYLTALIVHFTF